MPEKARGWLFSILRHRAYRRYRRREIAAVGDERLAEEAVAPGRDVLARLADRDAVDAALATLPEPQRLALVLMYVEGLDSYAAAERLGVSRGTVLSRIHRARQALRGALREEDA